MSLEGRSIGNYVVKAKLGEGGMGAVYLGEHPLIGKKVAIKVLREELASNEDVVRRFFNEARAVNDIHHQNIVDIVDFGKVPSGAGGEIAYIIMEYLDGESLASRLRSVGLRVPEVVEVIQQCCWALAASHAKGIVHRDLKPDNIYLCPRGPTRNFVKLLDFGIAKLTADTDQRQTRTGTVIGTPHYMSPEQCEGNKAVDARSDVYSLGVVMYELITGRVPFPGDGFGEILVAHLTKVPDAPSAINQDVTPEVEAIVLHAIEKDRNRRFQSMAEMEQALRDPAAHFAAYRQLPGYTAPSASTSNHGTMVLGANTPTVRGPSALLQAVPQGPVTQAGTRVTTLSGASGEVTNVAGGRSRTPLIAGMAAVVTLGLAAGGWLVFRPKAPDATTAAQPQQVVTQVAAPKDESVTITITSEPLGAHVIRADQGGADVGATPVEIKAKKGDPSFDVQIRKDGFKSQTRSVSTSVSKEIVVELAKVEEPPPAQPKIETHPAEPSHTTHKEPTVKKKSEGGKKKGSVDSDGIMMPSF